MLFLLKDKIIKINLEKTQSFFFDNMRGNLELVDIKFLEIGIKKTTLVGTTLYLFWQSEKFIYLFCCSYKFICESS